MRFRPALSTSTARSMQGFTLIETLVVIVIIGVFATIATPSWLSFWNRQKLSSAQDFIAQNIKQAQILARQQKIMYQFSIRQKDDRVSLAIHPKDSAPIDWKSLPEGIQLDTTTTTFLPKDAMYIAQFNHNGNVNGRLGKIVINTMNDKVNKRCVFVSTLIGATRLGETSRPDRICD